MKERLSKFARWWIGGTLVVLGITAILEPGLFLGDLDAACDVNVLLRMLYNALSLLIICPFFFMLANGNGKKILWMGFCLVSSIAMAFKFEATDADIFLLLMLLFALGFSFAPFSNKEKP